MIGQGSSVAGSAPGGRVRLAVMIVAAAVRLAVALTSAALLLTRASSSAGSSSSGPAATWAAGARPAPDFALRDQDGRPVSLAALRGRPVLLTFIDPLCRNLCPLEAKVLERAVAAEPAASRPVVVAVSVNPRGNARSILSQDDAKWRLGPHWRWAVGAPAVLARTWRAYGVDVLDTTKTVAGVTVHDVTHTEGSYLIDASGHERALFLWPYAAADVRGALASL